MILYQAVTTVKKYYVKYPDFARTLCKLARLLQQQVRAMVRS